MRNVQHAVVAEESSTEPFKVRRSAAKRLTDIVVAAGVLVMLSPVLLLAAAVIVLTMGRPVFFVQERTGWSGRRFRLLKLRTMKGLYGPDGTVRPDAERLTAVGRFLRKSSIDELPELLNVVRGDMSLVGPRPLLTRYDEWYTDRERLRFAARPGITGFAQVNGRNGVGWDARLAMDVAYVLGWSYWKDIDILARTAWQSLAGSGVIVDPGAAMQDLDQERR